MTDERDAGGKTGDLPWWVVALCRLGAMAGFVALAGYDLRVEGSEVPSWVYGGLLALGLGIDTGYLAKIRKALGE